MSLAPLSFAFEPLRAAYRAKQITPHEVIDEVVARIERDRDRVQHAWLHRATPAEMHAAVDRALARAASGQPAPLLGIPFGVKDNIDVGGVPTTIACPVIKAASLLVRNKTAPVISPGSPNRLMACCSQVERFCSSD